MSRVSISFFFFFFNDTANTEIYTLSLHDALPISSIRPDSVYQLGVSPLSILPPTIYGNWPRYSCQACVAVARYRERSRSEEHTSELQSLTNLVCRLLLEKKNNTNILRTYTRYLSL